jgi:hypothetical protein
MKFTLINDLEKHIENKSWNNIRFQTKQIDLVLKRNLRCQHNKINFTNCHSYKSQNNMKNNNRNIKTMVSSFNNYMFIINILFLSSVFVPSVNSSDQFGKFLSKSTSY